MSSTGSHGHPGYPAEYVRIPQSTRISRRVRAYPAEYGYPAEYVRTIRDVTYSGAQALGPLYHPPLRRSHQHNTGDGHGVTGAAQERHRGATGTSQGRHILRVGPFTGLRTPPNLPVQRGAVYPLLPRTLQTVVVAVKLGHRSTRQVGSLGEVCVFMGMQYGAV